MRRGLFLFVLIGVLIPVATFTALGSWFSFGLSAEARQFQETLRLVSNHFVNADELDTRQLAGEAIDKLLHSLDENSEYLPRKEAEEFEIETEQKYGGIGVEVEWIDERVTIISPFADSPGELAGLLPGDQFIRIAGESLDGKRYPEVVGFLRGAAGSKIRFSVYRPSTHRELELEVTRRVIKVDSVRDVGMMEPGIGYIRITQFGVQTYNEFVAALDALEKQGLQGLILDMRNNPGGVLTAAVDIAGEYFAKGETVVYTKGKDASHDKLYPASTPVRKGDYPMVILVNHGSASASEVVAGALKDIGRAKLVGTKTFGKGSVQTIFQYRSGDAMRLTTAMFFTPGGHVIHKQGIEPDFVVPLDDEDLHKLMLQRRYLKSLGAAAFAGKYKFEPIKDKQLEVALKVLRDRR